MKLLSFCKNNEHRYVMAKKMPTTELLWFGAKKQFSYKNQNAQNHEYDHFVVEKRLNFWVAVAAAFFMIRLNSFVQNALIWKWMQKLVWEMTKKIQRKNEKNQRYASGKEKKIPLWTCEITTFTVLFLVVLLHKTILRFTHIRSGVRHKHIHIQMEF